MVSVDAVDAAVPRGLRTLLWGRAVSALGDGLWFTIWAVFFTRILGLSMILVGVGLAVAAGVGMAAAVPIGAMADRLNPRLVLVAITAVRAVAMASYLLVHDTVTFMAVTIPFTALATGGTAVRTALIAGLVLDNGARMRTLAQQRVAQHVGYAIGAGIGCPISESGEDRMAVTARLGAFKTSMLQDVEAGRLIELEALLGAPREIAGRIGIETPALDRLYGVTRLMAEGLQLI